jgi:hypothetical protein
MVNFNSSAIANPNKRITVLLYPISTRWLLGK